MYTNIRDFWKLLGFLEQEKVIFGHMIGVLLLRDLGDGDIFFHWQTLEHVFWHRNTEILPAGNMMDVLLVTFDRQGNGEVN